MARKKVVVPEPVEHLKSEVEQIKDLERKLQVLIGEAPKDENGFLILGSEAYKLRSEILRRGRERTRAAINHEEHKKR